MKSENLITALVTAGTLFLTKIMLDDVILRTKKDELERRLENAMRNYEDDSRKLTEKEKDEVNKEYDSLCAKLVITEKIPIATALIVSALLLLLLHISAITDISPITYLRFMFHIRPLYNYRFVPVYSFIPSYF